MTCFLESQITQCGKYLLSQIIASFFSKVKSRFGLEREFLESQLAQCRKQLLSQIMSYIFGKSKRVFVWKGNVCMPRALAAAVGTECR
jgi:hypothetical protein